jgi:pyridoxal phosphate enzyme (YggS family)
LHHSITNLVSIQNKLKTLKTNIIAVSKTFPVSEILPLVNQQHLHFGENKVQEAVEKWPKIKQDYKDIKLHMIGRLQTNKVKFVIPLFDYIHSLDSLKLAKKIYEEQNRIKKNLKIFIQVNIGKEDQKSGINEGYLEEFYKKCISEFNLDIVGLMCLPPNNSDSSDYFLKMKDLAKKHNLKELSMGMSNDYLDAVKHGATFVRIGSAIFGNRS